MMWRNKIDQGIEWYLRKIGTYDKKPWEKSVEERLYKAIHGLQSFPKKSGKVKAELIDVDLVRGSPFTKAKPQFSWLTLAKKGLCRLLLSPFYRAWWSEQISLKFWLMMQVLYALQLAAIVVYFLEVPQSATYPTWRLSNILTPALVMLVLSIVHSQIVSTHGRDEFKNLRKKKSNKKRRKPRGPYSTSEMESASQETGMEESARSVTKQGAESEKIRGDKNNSSRISPARRARSVDKVGPFERKPTRTDLHSSDKPVSESSPLSSSESDHDKGDSDPDWFGDISVEEIYVSEHKGEIETAGEIIPLDNDENPDLSLARAVDVVESISTDTLVPGEAEPIAIRPLVDSELSAASQAKQDSAVEADRPAEKVEEEQNPRRRPGSSGLRRRRRSNLKVAIDTKPVQRPEPRHEISGISSGDSETEQTRTGNSMPSMSEVEWERINSDMATSDTSYCMSDGSELSDDPEEMISHDDPFSWTLGQQSNTAVHNSHTPAHDKVSCYIWEGEECKKVDLTVLDIGWTIIRRVEKIPDSADYMIIGVVFTLLMACVPLAFRAFVHRNQLTQPLPYVDLATMNSVWEKILGQTWGTVLLAVNGVVQRACLSFMFFFLLSVAERTFKQRLWYAKHFCHLTSSRRARKYDLPHFRLKKVRNIKTWLSLRSYLRKCGPQRSVDVIVSTTFVLAVTLVALMCVQLLKDSESFLESIFNWELTCWSLALGLYLLRVMTLGTKINKKYRNFSVLITEQINLYLHMEQKPHKKEELMLANNVLKLAEDLLKELESPFKISGLSADPFLYNATKVIILSAFSAVLTELLGFKLKLYKIKIKT